MIQILPLDLGIGQGFHPLGGLVIDRSRAGVRLEDWSGIGIGFVNWQESASNWQIGPGLGGKSMIGIGLVNW